MSCANQSTHRPLNVVKGVLCGPVQACVVDYHASYDVGHLIFELEMRREYRIHNAMFPHHTHSADRSFLAGK